MYHRCQKNNYLEAVAYLGFHFGVGFKIVLENWGYLHGPWQSHAFAKGVRGHVPPRNFLKMMQFGAF